MKLIYLVLMLAISISLFSQQTTPVPNTDYLKKSRKQKTAAWVLLGGGAALTVTGLSIGVNSAFDELASQIGSGQDSKSFVAGEILFYTGCAAMLSSIPFFIAAHRNKKKGMSLSLKNESAPQILKNSFTYRPIPSLTLKINL